MTPPSSMVSPGLWGFVAFFALALALYLLMRNMNGRMRRMSYRIEELQREAQAAEEQAAKSKATEGRASEVEPDASAEDVAPGSGSRQDGDVAP